MTIRVHRPVDDERETHARGRQGQEPAAHEGDHEHPRAQGMTLDAVTLQDFEAEWRKALSGSTLSSSSNRARIGGEGAARGVAPANRSNNKKKSSIGRGGQQERGEPPNGEDDDVDPFDCSSVEIPSLHELVEETATKFVSEWKALDGRKINLAAATSVPPRNDEDAEKEEELSPPQKKKKSSRVPIRQDTGMPLWYDHPNRVRLPLQFDYLCRHPTAEAEQAAAAAAEAPATANADEHMPCDPRVQSLVDPTVTTSYRAELWNLFSRIPSAMQLRRQLDNDEDENNRASSAHFSSLTRMRRLATGYSASSHFRSQPQSQLPTKKKRARTPTATQDSLGLWTRLRMSDRHEPPPLWLLSLTAAAAASSSDPPATEVVATIRFECWRGPHVSPTLTVLPDSNRMSVEFLKSHTLLDFHRVLVEHTRDALWTKLRRHVAEVDADPSTANGEHAVHSDDDDDDGGFFFMEDTFYVAGSKASEYVAPILAWLKQKGPAEHSNDDDDDDDDSPTERSRLARLGLGVASSQDLKIVPMSETTLEDLALRLGVRYVHVHHGNVECSVYCVDRRVHVVPPECRAWSRMHPILHDVWTNPYATPACEACQHRTAALVTAPACDATDGGPRALCGACARQLQVPASELELYTIYRGG